MRLFQWLAVSGGRGGSGLRGARGAGVVAGLVVALGACPAWAFPSLNLTPGTPEIESVFITVDYVGNNAGGLLMASGFAQAVTPPGSPSGIITGGTFDINANINFNAQVAIGTLNIGGTVAGLGFNSGTLLTGTFSSMPADQMFGAGPGDPLEFLFDITGGDAAGLYGGIGSQAGVNLSQSGYAGSFAGNFTSGAFQALADTFALPNTVPEPVSATLGVMGLGVLGLVTRRRRG